MAVNMLERKQNVSEPKLFDATGNNVCCCSRCYWTPMAVEYCHFVLHFHRLVDVLKFSTYCEQNMSLMLHTLHCIFVLW